MINTQGAVILGMVYNYIPFMILPIYTTMCKIGDDVIEGAITGRALYEGVFTVGEALDAAREGGAPC